MNIKLSLSIALAKRQKTQAWLADELNTSMSYISNVKNGSISPSIERLQSICKALDMKVSEFVALGEDE